MNGFPVDFWTSLSDRSRASVGIISIDESYAAGSSRYGLGGEQGRVESAEIGRAAAKFDEVYRGVHVVSLGGPFQGRTLLGVNGQRPYWRTREGVDVFRCAVHQSLQCAVVTSVDGRIGCSWTGEFTPLFDSLELFLENAVAWAMFQGWRYDAVGDFSTEYVLRKLENLTPDAVVAGKMASWWVSPDYALVANRYLNPARGKNPQVCVLAKTPTVMEMGRRRLAGPEMNPLAFRAADEMSEVARL